MHGEDERLIRQAIAMAQNGDMRGAVELATRACQTVPHSIPARLFAGELRMRAGMPELALDHYGEAAALAPADPRIRLNIGIALRRLGRHDEALAAYREAVAIGPEDAGANQALAMALYQIGELETARDHLAIARAGGAADPYTIHAFVHFALGKIETLSPVEADPGQQLGEETLQALWAWARGDTEACSRRLVLARSLLEEVEKAPNVGMWRHYVALLDGLLAWRRENAQAYVTDEEVEPFFVVGDSHVLASSNLLTPIDGHVRRFQSRLIFGCKAGDLIGPGASNHKAAFEAAVRDIPEGADVAFCFGEPDCRYSTGVLAHARAHVEDDADAEIDRLARAYGEWVLRRAAAGKWNPAFLTFPHSRVREGLIPASAREQFDRVRAAFPAVLREIAAQAGVPVIDLNQVTEHDATPYIDQNHVTPRAVLNALAQ